MVLDKTYTLKDLTYRISSSLERNADDSGNSSYGTEEGYIVISIMEYSDDVTLDIADKEKAKEMLQDFIDFYEPVKYSLQGTTQGNGLTGGLPPVRFSM